MFDKAVYDTWCYIDKLRLKLANLPYQCLLAKFGQISKFPCMNPHMVKHNPKAHPKDKRIVKFENVKHPLPPFYFHICFTTHYETTLTWHLTLRHWNICLYSMRILPQPILDYYIVDNHLHLKGVILISSRSHIS